MTSTAISQDAPFPVRPGTPTHQVCNNLPHDKIVIIEENMGGFVRFVDPAEMKVKTAQAFTPA